MQAKIAMREINGMRPRDSIVFNLNLRHAVAKVKTHLAATEEGLRKALEWRPDAAQVLIFLNQNTTSRDNPVPVQTASSVKVGLTKVDGAWRISSFDPV